jgi:hypothetical protein
MGKGTSAMENVRFLKQCREYGVSVSWNLMYGFPGETDADYGRMLELLPAIRHLDPPVAWGPVSLDRFSPWFRRPSGSGFRNARPLAAYRHVYPFPESALRRVAYAFDYDDVVSPLEGGLLAELAAWRDGPRVGGLDRHDQEAGTMTVRDRRDGGHTVETKLDALEALVCRACDEPPHRSALAAYLGARLGAEEVVGEEIEGRLAHLVSRRLLVTDGVRYLSLVPGAPAAG